MFEAAERVYVFTSGLHPFFVCVRFFVCVCVFCLGASVRIFFLVLCQPTTATTTTIRRAPGFIDNINGFAFLNNAHERKYVRARARDIILICVRFFFSSRLLCVRVPAMRVPVRYTRGRVTFVPGCRREAVCGTHTPHTQNTHTTRRIVIALSP